MCPCADKICKFEADFRRLIACIISLLWYPPIDVQHLLLADLGLLAVCHASYCLCRVHGISADICNLPDDVLGLILDGLNFGGNKRDVWAVSGSCKSMHAALARYPANIKLEGKWKQYQIAGLNFQSIRNIRLQV
jgi:hypothetical protein